MERLTDTQQTIIAEEVQLVKSILDGHTACFRRFIDCYASTVQMFVGRFLSQQEDVEEVTQDVFLTAYQSLQRFDKEKASFKTWLLRIAYHCALKHLRHEPQIKIVEMEDVEMEALSDGETAALLGDTTPDRLTLLRKAISQLAPDDQMLISLHYYDGHPLREIAYIVERTDTYLSSRLQWLRKKIHQTVIHLERNERY